MEIYKIFFLDLVFLFPCLEWPTLIEKKWLPHLMQLITTVPMLTTEIEYGSWYCSIWRAALACSINFPFYHIFPQTHINQWWGIGQGFWQYDWDQHCTWRSILMCTVCRHAWPETYTINRDVLANGCKLRLGVQKYVLKKKSYYTYHYSCLSIAFGESPEGVKFSPKTMLNSCFIGVFPQKGISLYLLWSCMCRDWYWRVPPPQHCTRGEGDTLSSNQTKCDNLFSMIVVAAYRILQ